LRKEDHAVVAGRVAEAARRGDEAADPSLREIYDDSVARADGAEIPAMRTRL
jgi:hypothetical protein